MKQDNMSIDQQIRNCEEKIARLEQNKQNQGHTQGRIEKSLDEQYEQIALLKIRKMMDY